MNCEIQNTVVNLVWNIADDVLRDVYVRGKYRDVILPMTVIRRLDALLEPTKEAVLNMKKHLDSAGIANQDATGKIPPDPLYGLYKTTLNGKKVVIQYEPDSNLRDSEQVPLLEEGGIAAFIEREVRPYTPDAWVDDAKTQTGYEISFTKHFYKPVPMRTLAQIKADIFAIEKETDGLLEAIIGEVP